MNGPGTAGKRKKRKRTLSIDEDIAASAAILMGVTAHDKWFNALIDMFPESMVMMKTDEEREEQYLLQTQSRYMKHKKGAAAKHAKKEESKKKKRARYDAANAATTLEKQQGKAGASEGKGAAAAAGHSSDSDEESDSEARQEHAKKLGLGGSNGVTSSNLTVGSTEALRERVRERIEELQKARAAKEGGFGASKRAEKRLANKKPSKNEQKKAAALKQHQNLKGKLGAKAKAKGQKSGADASKHGPAAAVAKAPKAPAAPALPSVEDIGDIAFGGLNLASSHKKMEGHKANAPGSKMRQLKGLLQAAEAKQVRLAQLKGEGEEGKAKAKEEQWADALKVAGGTKVKDNPAAIKKAIKRKENAKKKSAQKWGDRTQKVAEQQRAKQNSREENLKKRRLGLAYVPPEGEDAPAAGKTGGRRFKQEARDDGDDGAAAGKGGDKGGRGGRRAGFEGKKSDFINKKRKKG
ncbi:unnamed protein product [Chrysoparadoxa australica]